MAKLIRVFVLPILLLAGCVSHRAQYQFDHSQQEYLAMLPPPPSETSLEHQAELRMVAWAQLQAGEAERAKARREIRFTLEEYQDAAGVQLMHLPETVAFFDRLAAAADPVVDSIKEHYMRPRPPAVAADITALDPGNFNQRSYPSGHSYRAFLFALALADLFPEKRAALIEVGKEIGWRRMVAGMHHPSDVYAGRMLAQLVWLDLQDDRGVQADLKKVRDEIARGALSPERPAEVAQRIEEAEQRLLQSS